MRKLTLAVNMRIISVLDQVNFSRQSDRNDYCRNRLSLQFAEYLSTITGSVSDLHFVGARVVPHRSTERNKAISFGSHEKF